MASKKKASPKIAKVMHEYKVGTLHSGSKKGPVVKSQKQAIAIALSEAMSTNKKHNAKEYGSSAGKKRHEGKEPVAKKKMERKTGKS